MHFDYKIIYEGKYLVKQSNRDQIGYKRRITMDNNDRREVENIELFDREIEVINRVNILNQQGYREKDMYIITNDENGVSILRGLTDIVIKEEDASILDRFKSFLKGEDTITDAFNRLGLDEEEKEFYKEEVSKGKYLLFVDKEYGSYYRLSKDGEYELIPEEERENILNKNKGKEEPVPKDLRKDVGLEEEAFDEHERPHDAPEGVLFDVRDKI